jgi:hypothetical protein
VARTCSMHGKLKKMCFGLWTRHVGGRANLAQLDLLRVCVFVADVTKLAVLSNGSVNSFVIMNCKGCGRKGS